MTSIGRPYQYMQSFRVYWQDTEVMDDGMVVKGDEKEASRSRYEDNGNLETKPDSDQSYDCVLPSSG